MGDLEFTVLQYNTLAKSAADTKYFPYAVSRKRVIPTQLGNVQGSQDHSRLGSLAAAVARGSPDDFFDQPGEGGTFGSQVLSGEVEADGVDRRKIVLSWAERLPVLIARILQYSPDLVCLEEVDPDTEADFMLGLLEYQHVYLKPGCCLLWRSATFQAVGVPELLAYSDGKKTAIIQPLRALKGGASLVVAMTHLHWDPTAPFQTQEAKELVQALEKHAATTIVLAGDFNAGPRNRVMTDVLQHGVADRTSLSLIDLETFAKPCQSFTTHVPRAPSKKLTDARTLDDPENPVKIDHVFMSVPSQTTFASVYALDFGGGFVPSACNGLPSLSLLHASDHIPVGYRVALKGCL